MRRTKPSLVSIFGRMINICEKSNGWTYSWTGFCESDPDNFLTLFATDKGPRSIFQICHPGHFWPQKPLEFPVEIPVSFEKRRDSWVFTGAELGDHSLVLLLQTNLF